MAFIKDQFDRAKGQRGEFYMPTWQPDLMLKLPIDSSNTNFRVDGQETLSIYADDTVFRAVMILLLDGTQLYAKIINIIGVSDSNGDDTLIELAGMVGRDIEPDEVQMISWMPVWRHATDQFSGEFITDQVGQTQLTIQTLEDLTPET